MRIYELREKEVVNICDCKRIGFVADVEIDPKNGCVEAIIVPECSKLCGLFGKDNEYVIPWNCIRQIGPDIILVEVCLEDVLVKCKL